MGPEGPRGCFLPYPFCNYVKMMLFLMAYYANFYSIIGKKNACDHCKKKLKNGGKKKEIILQMFQNCTCHEIRKWYRINLCI